MIDLALIPSMQMNKLVYIIILNWNGFKDTIECVESCLKLVYPSYEIVVVDNGSDDGSETIIREHFPGLKFIQTGANLGYAGGNNAGIRYAIKEGADYIWLLNNDTTVDPKALSELVNIAEMDPVIGITGSKILSYSQPSVLLFAGGLLDLSLGTANHIGEGRMDIGQFDTSLETGYITGCSLLVKRSVINDIGLMNENYFLYYEETEWCIKAKEKAYTLIYVPKSIVLHKESVSTQKRKGSMTYYLTRNQLYFIEHNGINVQWLKRFKTDLLYLLKLIYRKDLNTAHSIFTAYVHWISGYMGPLDNPVKINRHRNYGYKL